MTPTPRRPDAPAARYRRDVGASAQNVQVRHNHDSRPAAVPAEVTIPRSRNGPAGSANGGFAAGLFAAAGATDTGATDTGGGQAWQVTLRLPPPLATPLSVAGQRILAPDGATVAELAPGADLGDPVPGVSYPEAVAAARDYPGFTAHPFPHCYVCGPGRADGLRIFPGPVGGDRLAAPWLVPDEVAAPTVWAALDCPGGWLVLTADQPYLLGRMAAGVYRVPAPGEQCVVVAGAASRQGRKALVHTALYDSAGALLATARATWIAVA